MREEVDSFAAYPDPLCRDLAAAIAGQEGIPAEWVLPCAGATDAITRVCLALRPKRALVCDPCYSGYEQALGLVGAQVAHHALRAEDGFALGEGILEALGGADAAFIANPNNPTGLTVEPELLGSVLACAREVGCTVALDESFLPFTGEPSAVGLLGRFPNLVIVRSFTKIYAMAGVRLGCLLCADTGLVKACRTVGQPWAVSAPAQVAGLAALREVGFGPRTRRYVREWREQLAGALRALGLEVLPGQANFLLAHAPRPMAAPLLERGILVRDCRNFAGLDSTWFRVAVRTGQENRRLAEALADVLNIGVLGAAESSEAIDELLALAETAETVSLGFLSKEHMKSESPRIPLPAHCLERGTA